MWCPRSGAVDVLDCFGPTIYKKTKKLSGYVLNIVCFEHQPQSALLRLCKPASAKRARQNTWSKIYSVFVQSVQRRCLAEGILMFQAIRDSITKALKWHCYHLRFKRMNVRRCSRYSSMFVTALPPCVANVVVSGEKRKGSSRPFETLCAAKTKQTDWDILWICVKQNPNGRWSLFWSPGQRISIVGPLFAPRGDDFISWTKFVLHKFSSSVMLKTLMSSNGWAWRANSSATYCSMMVLTDTGKAAFGMGLFGACDYLLD